MADTDMPLDVMYPFSNDYVIRNAALLKAGMQPAKMISTGTTIVGVKFKDGIVVGADSRATSGNVVADKFSWKLHPITDSIFMAGAGTAADLQEVGRMVSAQMKLMELNTNRKARVATAARVTKQHLFGYQGHVGAYVIFAGVDSYGPHICSVHAHGSVKTADYLADGSGSLASTGLLERDFKRNMSMEEALKLTEAAVRAGMQDDLSSGNYYNYKVVTSEGVIKEGTYLQPEWAKPNEKQIKKFNFPPGATRVLKEKKIPFDVVSETMDVS